MRNRRDGQLLCHIDGALLTHEVNGAGLSTHAGLVTTVAVTTVCWLIAAYVAPQTDRAVLVKFYTLVRPAGPGWNRIRAEAGLPAGARVSPDNIPLGLLGWLAGCTAIWTALFAVGNFLYGRNGQAIALTVVFAVSATVLISIVRNLWQGTPTSD